MAKSINLNTRLNPKGVQGLKKKLIAGEITAKTFKAVIKRQILKQNDIIPSRQRLKPLRHCVRIIRKNFQLFVNNASWSILKKKFKFLSKNLNLIQFKPTNQLIKFFRHFR